MQALNQTQIQIQMKNTILLFFVLILVVSCKNDTKTETPEVKEETPEIAYAYFGDKIDADGAFSTAEMNEKFKTMSIGDTITTKMVGTITEVCPKKGCWMNLDMGDGKTVKVRFKDYGFFVPLDAKGEVVINGKAFVTETSVEDLKHYAEDAKKSEDEIAAITEPQITFGFEADGVMLKQ